MTPKQKATELVERYATFCWKDGVCDYDLAKCLALIAAKEVIEIAYDTEVGYNSKNYWNEVKTEIQKL